MWWAEWVTACVKHADWFINKVVENEVSTVPNSQPVCTNDFYWHVMNSWHFTHQHALRWKHFRAALGERTGLTLWEENITQCNSLLAPICIHKQVEDILQTQASSHHELYHTDTQQTNTPACKLSHFICRRTNHVLPACQDPQRKIQDEGVQGTKIEGREKHN